jgi:salicylate hydroxylase
MNVNAVVERPNWEVESWTMAGTTEECLNDFKDWNEDVHALMRSIDQPLKWAICHRPPLERWTVGRATLLGDACHSMVPFLAQGASIAIEDGLVLARALEKYGNDPERAFAAYEAARRERANKVVSGSAHNIRRFHNPLLADREQAPAYVLRSWGSSQVSGEALDWIFGYDAATAPI